MMIGNNIEARARQSSWRACSGARLMLIGNHIEDEIELIDANALYLAAAPKVKTGLRLTPVARSRTRPAVAN
jgi:hypothetical protein